MSRPGSGLVGGWGGGSSRPGSSREWVERCRLKREEEECKRRGWDETHHHMEKAQLQANFFNSMPSAPRCCTAEPIQITNTEEVEEVPKVEDQKDACEEDTIDKPADQNFFTNKHSRPILGPSEFVKPEIALLRGKLEALRESNAVEREKLQAELQHEAWQGRSYAARQLESARLNEFVRDAWTEQRQWREDDRRRELTEERRIEQEAEAKSRLKHVEFERSNALERQKKKEQYRQDLDHQLDMIRKQEEERRELEAVGEWLEGERERLMELEVRREELRRARDAHTLAVGWSRQLQLKLRQKATQVLHELAEDQALLQQLLHQRRPLPPLLQQEEDDRKSSSEAEVRWVLSVLAEQRRLEEQRRDQYDLLFSEDAGRLWRVREQEWQEERRARQALLDEVMKGRQKQVEEQIAGREAAEQRLQDEKAELTRRVGGLEAGLAQMQVQEEEETATRADATANASKVGSGDGDSGRAEQLQQAQETEADHRKEIARLEAEMARLWGPLYKQPHYGRKKVEW